MVAKAAENTVGRTKACERMHHLSFCRGIVGEVVAGQRHQVGFQSVGDCDATANLVRGDEGADVKVGKLNDANPLKGFGYTFERNALAIDFHFEPDVKKLASR